MTGDHWGVLRSLLPAYRAVTTSVVKDGRGTSFWFDAWAGDDDLATRFPALLSHVKYQEASVREVVDDGLESMLVLRLTPQAVQDLEGVRALLDSMTLTEEADARHCFAATEDNKLQTAGVYQVLCGGDAVLDVASKFIWTNKAPPRVQFFGWLAVRGRIKCRSNLTMKGIVPDAVCEVCHGGNETTSHVLFHCEFAKQWWARLQIVTPSGDDRALLHLVSRPPSLPAPHYNCFVLLCSWSLWKRRNVMLYFDSLGPHAFMESLREQMFKPSLSTIITENSCAPPVVSPSDPVILAAKKMREHRVNSVVVMTGNTLLGILTSKDLVLRVLAQDLSPDATIVEKAMTANPDCATVDTSILDALHSMQDGKFLHIPVIGRNGQIVACLDALQLTHAAISMVEGASAANDVANSMMHKFWDSALAIHPAEEFDARSDESRMAASESPGGKHIHPPHVNNSFCFKIEDRKERMHRFSCVSESLDELVSAVAYRLGMESEKSSINLLYDDDEGDRVLLTSDGDLTAAIQHAKSAGWKVLRLHMDELEVRTQSALTLSTAPRGRPFLWFGIVAGGVAVAVIVYLKRSQL